jgi:hypothetical protein
VVGAHLVAWFAGQATGQVAVPAAGSDRHAGPTIPPGPRRRSRGDRIGFLGAFSRSTGAAPASRHLAASPTGRRQPAPR